MECLSSEGLFSSQVHAHSKPERSVWAYCPLLWSVHQHQLHPSFVCTGWVWVSWLCPYGSQIWRWVIIINIVLLQASMWPWPLIDGGVSTPASRCLTTWWWWCLGTSTAQMRGVVCCDEHSWDTPTYPQFLFSVRSAQECTSASQLWIKLWRLVRTTVVRN